MAETTKKTKAPARPRAASSTPQKTAAKKEASGSAKTAAKKEAPASAKTALPRPTHEEIARLAQQYWAERGHADGQAEQDWLRAEQELLKLAS